LANRCIAEKNHLNKTANITAASLAPALSRPSEPAISSSSFDEKVTIETADQLLRGSGQYNRWQLLRQKNDNSALQVADSLVERHRLLMAAENGEQVNWRAFDDLTRSLSQFGIHLYDSGAFQKQYPPRSFVSKVSNNLGTTAVPLPVSAPPPMVSIPQTSSAKSLLNEENSLIFNMTCAPIALQETAFGYGDDDTTLLPLGELSAVLDLKIDVDAEKGTATGWFISEDRTFSLDINREKIRIGETEIPWKKESVFAHDGEVYVDSQVLSTWLPLDFDISRAELTVDVIPLEKLPLQARMEREQQRLRMHGRGDEALKYPVRKLEYELFSMPVMDVSISNGSGTENLAFSELQSNYSILGRNDLLYMNSHMYLSGSKNDPLNIARIRLERFDPDAELLGPVRARQIAVGDIIPTDFPLLPNPSPERGMFVSNSSMIQRSNFDVTTFEGNILPGWEVELYFNGDLIDSTLVRSDGRYLFEDVPLFYGSNSFQVLAHGPQGQKKILEETTIPVGSNMLPEGESRYDFSISQRKKTLFGIDERNGTDVDNAARFRGTYERGLSDSISMAFGEASVDFGGERHNYLQLGLAGNTSFIYGQVDGLYDTASGGGLSLFAQTAVGPLYLKARHEWFADMVQENRPNSILESKSGIDVSGTVPETSFTPRFSYLLSSENIKYQGSDSASVSNRLSTRLAGLNVSNNIKWVYENTQGSNDKLIQGQFKASGYAGPVRLLGAMDYDLGDKNNITRYGLSGHWSVTDRLSGGFDLVQESDYVDRTTASVTMDWDAGPATISPRLSYDSDGTYGAFLSLSFSVGPDPIAGGLDMTSEKRSNTGVVTASVYHDANNNQIYDTGDELLQDVEVVATQAGKSSFTEDNGRAAIAGLAAFHPTDVEIVEESLEDPFWQPSVAGVAVIPRPGHVDHLEIPVVSTGEVDGTLYMSNGSGAQEILANVSLELLDEEGHVVQSTRSEYDGFYLFEKVFPGEYLLRVSPEDSYSALAADQQQQIVIGNDGTIVSGVDMLFPGPEKTEPGEVAVQKIIEKPKVSFKNQEIVATVEEEVPRPVTKNFVASSIVKRETVPVAEEKEREVLSITVPAYSMALIEAEPVERKNRVDHDRLQVTETFQPFQVMAQPIESFIAEHEVSDARTGKENTNSSEAGNRLGDNDEYKEIIVRLEERKRGRQNISKTNEPVISSVTKLGESPTFEVIPQPITPFNPLNGARSVAAVQVYKAQKYSGHNVEKSAMKVLG
jgi:hypothetical protein